MINAQQGGIAALQPTPQQQLGSMVGAPSARLGAPKSPQQAAAEQIVESEVPRELEALLKERKALELLASAQRDKQAQQPVQPQTVKSQVEGGIASMMDRLRPGMAQRGRQMQMAQNRQAMGLPAAGMPRMASGGVVGYAKGDLVRASDIDMDNLLDALMIAESGGNPRAVSAAGAEGAYQIMPSTAAQPGFGVKPMEGSRFDPEASRKFARQYLQAMIDRYGGDVEAALIAYNAGAGNADKFVAAGRDYGVLPLAMQTQPYVDKIMGQLEREGRRRDIQLGGGRTLSTTAPESYTERMRRQRADRLRGIETARMPPRPPVETEAETAGIPEALTVARAQQELQDPGSTSDKYTPEERAAGGIGYLQYLARKQQEKKDEAGRAARYMGMMQNQEDIMRRANPATGLAGIDTRQELTSERSMKSPAQRLEEAVPGIGQAAARYAMSKNMPEAAAARIDERPESTRSRNPLVNLRSDLGEIGSYLRGILGFQEGGEIKKYAGEDGSLVEGDSAFLERFAVNPVTGERRSPEEIQRLARMQRYAGSLDETVTPEMQVGLQQLEEVAELATDYPDRVGEADVLRALEAIDTTRQEAQAEEAALAQKALEARFKKAGLELEPAGPQGTLQQLAATGETGAALAGLFGEGLERRGDDDPVRFRNVEEAREQAKDREGLMNRIGSALTSDRARAFADALSKLSYAGGATEGNIGKSLVTGLEAEAQAREKLRLQEAAIEADKLRSEATLEAARQTQQAKLRADLVDALGKYEGTTAYIQALNARVEAGEDPEAARTAIMQAKIAELMPLLTGQGGLTQMTGLTELPEGVTVTRKG
jgi:soluble lytic murein transglycosylase-like protein